jgi:hypothetical protein
VGVGRRACADCVYGCGVCIDGWLRLYICDDSRLYADVCVAHLALLAIVTRLRVREVLDSSWLVLHLGVGRE